LLCDSAEGRLICDEVVASSEMEAAIEARGREFDRLRRRRRHQQRRAFRVSVESLDLFRRYMAVYAREQAYCHFSPALIANLERGIRITRKPSTSFIKES